MNREMFVRVATMVLQRAQGMAPEAQAEAIAVQMDFIAAAMGETPGALAAPAAPVPPPVSAGYTQRAAPPPAFPAPPAPAVEPRQSMIVQATSMSDIDKVERARPMPEIANPPEPVRSLRGAPSRMKVEDLSQVIQDRTPPSIMADIQAEDGSMRRVLFHRNVVSNHSGECVRLLYYPPNALPSAREYAEVFEDIYTDEPVDLARVVDKLRGQMVEALRPRQVRPAPVPMPPSGPVQSSQMYPDGGGAAMAGAADAQVAQNVFVSIG